jgi:hypothetical protein
MNWLWVLSWPAAPIAMSATSSAVLVALVAVLYALAFGRWRHR